MVSKQDRAVVARQRDMLLAPFMELYLKLIASEFGKQLIEKARLTAKTQKQFKAGKEATWSTFVSYQRPQRQLHTPPLGLVLLVNFASSEFGALRFIWRPDGYALSWELEDGSSIDLIRQAREPMPAELLEDLHAMLRHQIGLYCKAYSIPSNR